jgi:hypothetical protein
MVKHARRRKLVEEAREPGRKGRSNQRSSFWVGEELSFWRGKRGA